MSLTIDIPPQEWMSANDRMHWAQKAKRTKALRSRAAWLARQARLETDTPVLVVASIGYPRGGKADPGNAAPTVKAILDGLTDAGVWPDDDSDHVIGPHYTRGPKVDQKGYHAVTLTFHKQHIPF